MRVLVACECSGRVRDAFIARGHDAMSCDLEDTETSGPHYKGDVWDLLQNPEDWDLIIAHPPCTHLASSGAKWFDEKRKDGRQQEAIEFFMRFTKLPGRWAIENPVGIMSTMYRKPDEIVQPWWFGDEAKKSTCLWLQGLPPLVADRIVGQGKVHVTKSGRKLPEWYNLPPSPDRAKLRSITFPGLARAMAEQWG